MKTITTKSTKKNTLTIAFLVLILNLLMSTPKTSADLLPGGETDTLNPGLLIGSFPLYIVIGIPIIIIAIISFIVLAKLRKK